MKTCIKCLVPKEESCFGKRKFSSGNFGLQPYCKECNKIYHKNHYESNKKDYKEKAKAYRKRIYEKFLEFLSGKNCTDCGITDRRILEFDHREEELKTDNISRMVNSCKWQSVLEEIEKCDIVCCNCHRIRTLTRLGCKK